LPDDGDRLERFIAHLISVDDRNTIDRSGGIRVHGMGDPPNAAIFLVSRGALEARLPTLVDGGAAIWHGVDPETAAFRLLSIHMMETVDSLEPHRAYRLTIDGFVPVDEPL
jgi:hypothetical protein